MGEKQKNTNKQSINTGYEERQLFVGFIFIGIIFLLVGVIVFLGVNRISKLTTAIYQHPLEVSTAALRASMGVVKMHRSMKDVVLSTDQLSLGTAVQIVEKEEEQVYQNLNIVKELILGREGQLLEEESRKIFAEWKPIREKVLVLMKNGDGTNAIRITQGQGAVHMEKIEQSLLGLTLYARDKADKLTTEATSVKKRVSAYTAIMVAAGFILSVLTAFIVFKNLSKATLRKQKNERDLAVSEKKYRALVEQSIIGFCIMGDEGLSFVNDHFCKIFGYSQQEILTSVLPQELILEADRERVQGMINQRLSGEIESVKYTARGRHKDGSEIWLEIFGTSIENDGTVIVTAFVLDITERVNIEHKLLEQKLLLDQMGGIAKIGGWRFNTETHEGTWTPETARIHDLDPDAPTNVAIGLDQYEGEARQIIESAVKQAIEEGKPYDLELEIITGKKNRKWVRTIGKPLEKNGKIVEVRGTIQDITQFKKTEIELSQYQGKLEELVEERTEELTTRMSESQQLNSAMINLMDDLQSSNRQLEEMSQNVSDANKELEGFAYSVSHDLRAPLRHMSGFVDLLEKHAGSGFDEKSSRYVVIIKESSEKMGQLIDDLLHYSRTSRTEMQCRLINTGAIVRDVIKELNSYEEERDIVWDVEPLPDVSADHSLMRIVWMNLLSNAIKFTRNSENSTIKIGNIVGENDEIVHFVKDNGAGFDMKYHEKLFGVFQRLHSDKEFEGTGIGLATVKRILHRHEGKIWAEGSVNNGATFYFSIPAK